MKTIIFNGSPRKTGGTSKIIEELKKHLSGEIIVINSYHTEIAPCVDCRYCWTNDKCAINDKMQEVYSQINEADNIIIASPIYFAELTGSLLSLMSRLQYIWVAKKFRGSDVLARKKRGGAVILVDGGDGHADTAMAMGKRLLRTMGAEFIGSVYFSGTDNTPAGKIILPEQILTEVKDLSEKFAALHKEMFFHASNLGGLKELLPLSKMHGSNEKVCYFTPNRNYALFYIRDMETNHVTCGIGSDGIAVYYEQFPNQLAKIYGGRRGYIYTAANGVAIREGHTGGVWISTEPVNVLKSEFIDDVYAEIITSEQSGKIRVIRYESLSDEKKAEITEMMKQSIIKNGRLQSDTAKNRFYKENFPEAWKIAKTEKSKPQND